jgi:chromosome segregation ATPase
MERGRSTSTSMLLEQKEEEIAELKDNISKIMSDYEKLKLKLKEVNKRNEEQFVSLKKKLVLSEQKNVQLDAQCKILMQKLETLSERDVLEDNIQFLQKMHEIEQHYKQELSKLQSEYQENCDNFQKSTEEIENKAERRRRKLLDRIKKIEAENNELIKKNRELLIEKEKLERENNEMLDKLQKREGYLILENENRKLQQENAELNMKYQKELENVSSLQKQLAKEQEKYDACVEQYESKLYYLRKQLYSVEKEKDNYKEKNRSLYSKLSRIKDEFSESFKQLENQIQGLSKELCESRAKCQYYINVNESLEKKLEKLKISFQNVKEHSF